MGQGHSHAPPDSRRRLAVVLGLTVTVLVVEVVGAVIAETGDGVGDHGGAVLFPVGGVDGNVLVKGKVRRAQEAGQLTTTGATTFATRETLPQSILFWRLQLEWIGGFLTLASLFLVLSPLAIGGLPRRAMASEWSMDRNAARDAGFQHLKRYVPMLGYYLAASVIVFFLFVASGRLGLDWTDVAVVAVRPVARGR